MKTRQQIIIDQYLARPVAYLMNFLVRILGKLLSIDHNLHRPFRRIVICKFKGLGSIIQCTPMLAAIRQQHPQAEIIFVSTKGNAGLLQKISLINTVITIDDKSAGSLLTTLSQCLWRLIRLRPDVYIDLEIYSNFSTLVTLFSLSRNRIGFYLRYNSFRMGIYTHMVFFNQKTSISEVYLQVARLFGHIPESITLYPLYRNISPDANSILPKGDYLVINPNASDLRIERRWGAQHFTLLIRQCLQRYPDMQIVLIGSPAEQAYTEQVIQDIRNEKVSSLAGKTTMDQLIALIRAAKLMVTNDTGPMHIAFACQTPVICLFGPCSPEQYGWSENASVIYKRVYCSPCVHDFSTPPCRGNNICMQLISVPEVMNAVDHYLQEGRLLHAERSGQAVIYKSGETVLGLVNRA